MSKDLKKNTKHPISIDNKYIEVFWLNRWHICEYDYWCPETEGSFSQPTDNEEYMIRYFAYPFNVSSYKRCSVWDNIHPSRVRKVRQTKANLQLIKKIEKANENI